MNRLFRPLLILPFVMVACDSGDEKEPTTTSGGFKADFATSSAFFTLMEGPETGNSPHSTVQIWYSADLRSRIENESFTAPVGATSIKEVDMDDDGTLDAYAVMVKREAGYDTANNDWYYEMRMPDGTVMADPPAGKTAMCIGCHAASAATDYLAGTRLR